MKKHGFFDLSLIERENLKEEKMENERREFVKKALVTSALVVTSSAIASDKNITESSSSGVAVGKSTKKEILYKETQSWDAFYKASY